MRPSLASRELDAETSPPRQNPGGHRTHAAGERRSVYDLLRDELLAQRLVDTFRPSIRIGNEPIATPSRRWDSFNRVNRKAVIEAVPFAVANYVDEVKRPSDEVLKKFFEENENALPDPTSPNSGFRRPQKVAIEYIKADVAQFAAKVSDAEVLKEYEDNKDEYDRISNPTAPPPRKPASSQPGEQHQESRRAQAQAESRPEPCGKVPRGRT